MGTVFRKQTKEEEEKIQDILDEIHVIFIEQVAKSRNMTYTQVEEYATGEIFLGSKALKAGFIDEIGLLEDAYDNLSAKTGAITTEVRQTEPSFAEALGLRAMFSFIPKNQIHSNLMLK
jgi:ClpP class serine protease